MHQVQVESVSAPLDDPELLAAAARLLMRVEAMGLLRDHVIRHLNLPELQRVFQILAQQRVAMRPALEAMGQLSGDVRRLRELVDHASSLLEETPVPQTEWDPVLTAIGEEMLSDVLLISPSSLRRYRSGSRPTPPEAAARLHFLALLIGDLAGAYNEIGIRNWLGRRRQMLDGVAPIEILTREWSPDEEQPRKIRELAESLSASPAT